MTGGRDFNLALPPGHYGYPLLQRRNFADGGRATLRSRQHEGRLIVDFAQTDVRFRPIGVREAFEQEIAEFAAGRSTNPSSTF